MCSPDGREWKVRPGRAQQTLVDEETMRLVGQARPLPVIKCPICGKELRARLYRKSEPEHWFVRCDPVRCGYFRSQTYLPPGGV